MKNKFLVLITARGGSKRLPGKNIKLLCGKPLIAYTIEAARKSKYKANMDIICSTDDAQIARVARKHQCDVPFKRPKNLALDTSTSITAAEHALRFMENFRSIRYDYVVLLQPTSPLRKSKHIDQAIDLMLKERGDSVISVKKFSHSPSVIKRLEANGTIKEIIKKKRRKSQAQSKNFVLNGAIYITRRDVVLKEKNFYGKKAYPYIMDNASSIDIDEMEDFRLAESVIKNK